MYSISDSFQSQYTRYPGSHLSYVTENQPNHQIIHQQPTINLPQSMSTAQISSNYLDSVELPCNSTITNVNQQYSSYISQSHRSNRHGPTNMFQSSVSTDPRPNMFFSSNSSLSSSTLQPYSSQSLDSSCPQSLTRNAPTFDMH